MKKMLFVILGLICFALGAIGAVLPMIPTTPFLLVATYCFARGSDKFNNWFINTNLYKNHLDSFVENREMTLKTKITICLLASLMLLIAFFMMSNIYGRITIIILIIIKYYYFIFKIKTI